MVLLALLPVWALACGGRAGDADRVSGSDGVSGSASEPEVLAELDGASYRLREGSGYVWWLRDGWLERVAKAGGAVEVISRASVYAVADDQLYLSESSGVITKYSLRGEPLGQVALEGGDSPSYCDELEARGSAVYCANGRGVFRSIDLSPDWRALGRSAEFRASALALGSSHVYWTTSALQRVPIDGGTSEVIGPSLLSGVDVLGDRVFFASNPGGLAGVYEYSETDGLVSRAGEFTRDVTVIESGLYALDVFGALRWHAFRSAERLLVDESTDPTREEVEADASHVYYLELSDGPSARRSRLLRLAHL